MTLLTIALPSCSETQLSLGSGFWLFLALAWNGRNDILSPALYKIFKGKILKKHFNQRFFHSLKSDVLFFPVDFHMCLTLKRRQERKKFLTLLCLFSVFLSTYIHACSNKREVNLISVKENFTFPVIYWCIIAYLGYCQLLREAKSPCSSLSWEGKFIQYNMSPLWTDPEVLIRTNCRFWQKSRGQKVRKKHQLQLSVDSVRLPRTNLAL